MAGHIRGITITLHEKTFAGYDGFGEPIWTTSPVQVDNVLVAPVSSDDIVNDFTLSGRKAVYQLGIPKGDTHHWNDVYVEFFGEMFHTFGKPIEGIEAMIPLSWNKKVYVERYEQG